MRSLRLGSPTASGFEAESTGLLLDAPAMRLPSADVDGAPAYVWPLNPWGGVPFRQARA